jgi:hypothetical protein
MLKLAVVPMVNPVLNWVNIFVVHLLVGNIFVINVGAKHILESIVNNH